MGPLTLLSRRPAQPNFPFKDEKGNIREKLEFSLFFSPHRRSSAGQGERRRRAEEGRGEEGEEEEEEVQEAKVQGLLHRGGRMQVNIGNRFPTNLGQTNLLFFFSGPRGRTT